MYCYCIYISLISCSIWFIIDFVKDDDPSNFMGDHITPNKGKTIFIQIILSFQIESKRNRDMTRTIKNCTIVINNNF